MCTRMCVRVSSARHNDTCAVQSGAQASEYNAVAHGQCAPHRTKHTHTYMLKHVCLRDGIKPIIRLEVEAYQMQTDTAHTRTRHRYCTLCHPDPPWTPSTDRHKHRAYRQIGRRTLAQRPMTGLIIGCDFDYYQCCCDVWGGGGISHYIAIDWAIAIDANHFWGAPTLQTPPARILC